MSVEYFAILNTADTGKSESLGGKPELVQFTGSIYLKEGNTSTFKTGVSFNIIPNEDITLAARSFTGISKSWIIANNPVQYQMAIEKIKNFVSILKQKSIYVVSWGVGDHLKKILEKNCGIDISQNKVIDLKKLAQRYTPIEELGDLTLDSVYLWFDKDTINSDLELSKLKAERFQGGFCLVYERMQLKVLQYLIDKSQYSSLSEIGEYLNQPCILSRMPFGKYSGKLFDDILHTDLNYLQWLRKNDDILQKNPDLNLTLKTIFNNMNT